MSVWSGETLRRRLDEGKIVEPFDTTQIDCASYTLAVGSEIYISPTDISADRSSRTIRRLNPGEAFAIPPGQFAFLITKETIHIPNDAMALISMKAKIKFRGLINISGFHVDPGYCGQLTFSVYNAGPTGRQFILRKGRRAS